MSRLSQISRLRSILIKDDFSHVLSPANVKLAKAFIHSGHFYSASSNPLLLRDAPDYSILYRVGVNTLQIFRQPRVMSFPKVPTWWLGWDLNLRHRTLPLSHHAPWLDDSNSYNYRHRFLLFIHSLLSSVPIVTYRHAYIHTYIHTYTYTHTCMHTGIHTHTWGISLFLTITHCHWLMLSRHIVAHNKCVITNAQASDSSTACTPAVPVQTWMKQEGDTIDRFYWPYDTSATDNKLGSPMA